MTHLFQPITSRTCGQHVVAMILDTTFEDVFYLFGHRRGTRIKELSLALNSRGIKVSNKLIKCKNGILPKYCIVAINGFNKSYRHWAVYIDGNIWCSNLGVYHISWLLNGDIVSYLELPENIIS